MGQLRRWSFVTAQHPTTAYFDFFTEVLELLNITSAEATSYFNFDYADAWTDYDDATISNVFDMVYQSNRLKYMSMADAITAEYNPLYNADVTEAYTDTRRPNLIATTTTSGSSSGTIKNNQTRTTTDNGGTYHEISDNKRDPYDGSGLRTEGQTDTHAEGSRTSSESYSGEPDTSSTTTSGTATEQRTGSETIEHNLRRYGNIGVTSSQSLVTQELDLAARRNVLKVIFKDIAAKLFLQVW